MSEDIFPSHFDAWKRCVTEKGGIPLSKDYVAARITALSDEKSRERKEFVAKYGTEWTDTVLGFFKQAQQEA